MFENLWSLLTQEIAIDLGTANTLVVLGSHGIVINEPSVVAIHKRSGAAVAVGTEAKKMLGRTPETIQAIHPLKDGVITDFNSAQILITFFIQKVFAEYAGIISVNRPKVIIGIPSLINEVEVMAVRDAAMEAGARNVEIVMEPIAAAIGSGADIYNPKGNLIIDIGGGTTDVAIISMGGMVVDKTIKIAGVKLDQAIADYLRNKYNLVVGLQQAEDLKVSIGSAFPLKKELQSEINGRDVITRLPKTVAVSSIEVREAILPVVEQIISAIRDALEEAPAELVSDLVNSGVYLAGGGGNLRGLSKFIKKSINLPVIINPEPELAVVRGVEKLLRDPVMLKYIQMQGGVEL